MPHKCTKCEEIFRSGDKRILSGCPVCGWNKFLFISEEAIKAGKVTESIDEETSQEAALIESEELEGGRIESIRILGPGVYELNIEALLDRKEIVMALKEEGKYIIHWPSIFDKKK